MSQKSKSCQKRRSGENVKHAIKEDHAKHEDQVKNELEDWEFMKLMIRTQKYDCSINEYMSKMSIRTKMKISPKC